jgi:hypothetical protein
MPFPNELDLGEGYSFKHAREEVQLIGQHIWLRWKQASDARDSERGRCWDLNQDFECDLTGIRREELKRRCERLRALEKRDWAALLIELGTGLKESLIRSSVPLRFALPWDSLVAGNRSDLGRRTFH